MYIFTYIYMYMCRCIFVRILINVFVDSDQSDDSIQFNLTIQLISMSPRRCDAPAPARCVADSSK